MMSLVRTIAALATLLLLMPRSFGQNATGRVPEPSPAQIKAIYRELLSQVRVERIRGDFQGVSAFGSRLAGSSGEAKTFDFVEQKLRTCGAIGVRRFPFSVTVPDPLAEAS